MFKFMGELNGLGKSVFVALTLIPIVGISYFSMPFLGNLLTFGGADDLGQYSRKAAMKYAELKTKNILNIVHKRKHSIQNGGADIPINDYFYFCSHVPFYLDNDEFYSPTGLRKSIRYFQNLDKDEKVEKIEAFNDSYELGIARIFNLLGRVSWNEQDIKEAISNFKKAEEVIKISNLKFIPFGTEFFEEPNLSELYGLWSSVLFQQSILSGKLSNLRDSAKYMRKSLQVQFNKSKLYSNYGCILSDLGYLNNDAHSLRNAIKQFTISLKRGKQDSTVLPPGYANVGSANALLGYIDNSRPKLRIAVKKLRQAINKVDRDRYGLFWSSMQHNLGNATYRLGHDVQNIPLLQESVKSYEAALQDFRRGTFPIYWAKSQSNLGLALNSYGVVSADVDILLRSVAAYEAALEVRSAEYMPLNWAISKNGLGQALLDLSKLEIKMNKPSSAQRHFEQAETVFKQAKNIFDAGYKADFQTYYSSISLEIQNLKQSL